MCSAVVFLKIIFFTVYRSDSVKSGSISKEVITIQCDKYYTHRGAYPRWGKKGLRIVFWRQLLSSILKLRQTAVDVVVVRYSGVESSSNIKDMRKRKGPDQEASTLHHTEKFGLYSEVS